MRRAVKARSDRMARAVEHVYRRPSMLGVWRLVSCATQLMSGAW